MKYKKNNIQNLKASTLLEMVVALAMMAVVFAAIVVLFRNVQTNWDSKAAAAETVQNGRVLIDHLNYNLSKAVKITAVSDSAETDGYIEFEDNDSDTLRYDISNNYARFGIVGNLADLAGPISSLQFTCYDGNDFETATTDVNSIRFVEAQTTLLNSAPNSQDKTFKTSAYLHTNGSGTTAFGYFGNQNIEDEDLTKINGYQVCSQVTLPVDTAVTSISAYVKGPTSKLLRFAIYTDDSGEPGTLLIESDTENAQSNLYYWHEISIDSTELSAGTYWLALAFEDSAMNVKQSAEGSGQTRHKSNDAIDNGFASPWDTSDKSNTRLLSIYATYLISDAISP